MIGVCGYGFSGSGAVVDVLKDFSNCIDVCGEKEFTFAYFPDGIDDLYYHIVENPVRFQSSDVAITRFLELIEQMDRNGWRRLTNGSLLKIAKEFLAKIIMIEWMGFWQIDIDWASKAFFPYLLYRLKRRLRRYNKRINVIKKRKMYFSLEPSDFLRESKMFHNAIIHAICGEFTGKTCILNQAFPANNPSEFMKYFEDAKAIVVRRDPRDTYLSLVNVQRGECEWFPHSRVEDFVIYYKKIHMHCRTEFKNVLILQYEDLVYETEKTIKKITKFAPEIGNYMHDKKNFKPSESIQNTQLFKYYKGYKKDILYIEEHLNDYLYDFKELKDIKHDSIF